MLSYHTRKIKALGTNLQNFQLEISKFSEKRFGFEETNIRPLIRNSTNWKCYK